MEATPSGGQADASAGSLSEAAVREQLERVLESPSLAYAPRLRRFLAFVVDLALAGHHSVNEYAIGVDVFDRGSEFDPRIDPIVRVHARRLRAKLKEYYATAGAADRIEITLPVRSYVPAFAVRRASDRQAAASSAFQPAPATFAAVALFPLAALSKSDADEQFADGLTQELLHALTRLKNLRVVAAESRFGRNRRPDFREIQAKDIGGAVWGMVRRTGATHRISVELVSLADRIVLWSGMYDAGSGETVSIQQRVAEEVSDAVRRQLDPESAGEFPADVRARRLLMKAQQSSGRGSRASIHASIHYLLEAVNSDPAYAGGQAALAEAYAVAALFAEFPPKEAMAKTKSHALSALELDPRLPEGHVALGIVAGLHERDPVAAKWEFSQALELRPKSSGALQWNAVAYLAVTQQYDAAIATLTRARELDPTSLAAAAMLAFVLSAAGSPSAALSVVTPFVAEDMEGPLVRWSSGVAYLTAGQIENAIREFEVASRQSGESSYAQASLSHALAAGGNQERARGLLKELEHRATTGYVPSAHLALAYYGLKQTAAAAASLSAAREDGCPWYALARIDPRFRDAGNDPILRLALG